MNFKNHVPSLATCQRMKTLGWKQNTNLIYGEYSDNERGNDNRGINVYHNGSIGAYNEVYADCSAPLATEIIAELPKELPPKYFLEITLDYKGYTVGYFCGDTPLLKVSHDHLTEALALLWISYREQSII